jgi:hypothetical protein
MRYVVNWLKDGERHGLFTGEKTLNGAFAVARALLEVHPDDIWIDAPGKGRIAGYEDIVESGPEAAVPFEPNAVAA